MSVVSSKSFSLGLQPVSANRIVAEAVSASVLCRIFFINHLLVAVFVDRLAKMIHAFMRPVNEKIVPFEEISARTGAKKGKFSLLT